MPSREDRLRERYPLLAWQNAQNLGGHPPEWDPEVRRLGLPSSRPQVASAQDSTEKTVSLSQSERLTQLIGMLEAEHENNEWMTRANLLIDDINTVIRAHRDQVAEWRDDLVNSSKEQRDSFEDYWGRVVDALNELDSLEEDGSYNDRVLKDAYTLLEESGMESW